MDVMTEAQKVVWKNEVECLDKMALEELQKLCDYGSPETRRAIEIAVKRTCLYIWSPGDDDKEQFRESAERAFKVLTELLEERWNMTTETTTKVVYSCRDLMQLLSLSKNAIYKAAQDNLLPGKIRIGGRILFSKVAIDKMLESGINPMERGQNDNQNQ
jgi:predicted DNA-binding transcriptional regulator AlpA